MTLHRIASGIIAEAAENGCTVIAFEELTGIRDRLSGGCGATSGPSSGCTSTSHTKPTHAVSPSSRETRRTPHGDARRVESRIRRTARAMISSA